MKYTKSQLNAISRSYSERNRKAQTQQLEERNLSAVWEHQNIYKSLPAFLNAKPCRLNATILNAHDNCSKRVEQLQKCGCTSSTLTEAQNDLKELQSLVEGLTDEL